MIEEVKELEKIVEKNLQGKPTDLQHVAKSLLSLIKQTKSTEALKKRFNYMLSCLIKDTDIRDPYYLNIVNFFRDIFSYVESTQQAPALT